MENGEKDVLFYVFKKDVKRLISGSYMPWISGTARVWRFVKACRRPSAAKGGG